MAAGILLQIVQTLLAIVLAPLLMGWVNQCRAWLQGRTAPPITQPYRTLRKLFHKDAVIAHDATPLFRIAPYMIFACMALAAGLVPTIANDLPLSPAADVIALVGIFALARVFLALAAMDIGTSFGTLGARREMLVSFLAEPALLMVFFTSSLISQSTELPVIVQTVAHKDFVLYPSLAFAAVAFWMVSIAENARIPVDNPTTHLELTMIHEAMILEYSARHLALIEWAVALKLFTYSALGLALFVPWGIAPQGDYGALPLAFAAVLAKLMAGGAFLAFMEAISAKVRLFRAPEFLGTAFLLGVLGMLIHSLLEV
jgi:formate hydrogenlyase subunit 4